MGWASGSPLGIEIYEEVRKYIPKEKRQEVAEFIYDKVCELDADDWDGDSVLELDAQIPAYCWECDKPIKRTKAEDSHYCEEHDGDE